MLSDLTKATKGASDRTQELFASSPRFRPLDLIASPLWLVPRSDKICAREAKCVAFTCFMQMNQHILKELANESGGLEENILIYRAGSGVQWLEQGAGS